MPAYGDISAFHYRAYRPPLHPVILRKALGTQRFEKGLDVGCGAGHSTLALAEWCDNVLGVDPEPDILPVENHTKVSFRKMIPGIIPQENNTSGIVTFAGSFYYARSQEIVDEINRVLQNEGVLLIYDFAVDYSEIIEQFNLPDLLTASEYKYDLDLSGYDMGKLSLMNKKNDRLIFTVNLDQLEHLLLAELAVNSSGEQSFLQYQNCMNKIHENSMDGIYLSADTFWVEYRIFR